MWASAVTGRCQVGCAVTRVRCGSPRPVAHLLRRPRPRERRPCPRRRAHGGQHGGPRPGSVRGRRARRRPRLVDRGHAGRPGHRGPRQRRRAGAASDHPRLLLPGLHSADPGEHLPGIFGAVYARPCPRVVAVAVHLPLHEHARGLRLAVPRVGLAGVRRAAGRGWPSRWSCCSCAGATRRRRSSRSWRALCRDPRGPAGGVVPHRRAVLPRAKRGRGAPGEPAAPPRHQPRLPRHPGRRCWPGRARSPSAGRSPTSWRAASTPSPTAATCPSSPSCSPCCCGGSARPSWSSSGQRTPGRDW